MKLTAYKPDNARRSTVGCLPLHLAFPDYNKDLGHVINSKIEEDNLKGI